MCSCHAHTLIGLLFRLFSAPVSPQPRIVSGRWILACVSHSAGSLAVLLLVPFSLLFLPFPPSLWCETFSCCARSNTSPCIFAPFHLLLWQLPVMWKVSAPLPSGLPLVGFPPLAKVRPGGMRVYCRRASALRSCSYCPESPLSSVLSTGYLIFLLEQSVSQLYVTKHEARSVSALTTVHA